MCKIPIALIITSCALVYLSARIAGAEEAKDHSPVRRRRFLSYHNHSVFFVRLNSKANMVPWTQIFAQAVGFRVNFEEPPETFHLHRPLRLHRRQLYTNMETLLDSNGLDGLNCIRRAICEVRSLPFRSGMYQNLLKIIFRRQSSATDAWHGVTRRECVASVAACPLSLLDLALYTDI